MAGGHIICDPSLLTILEVFCFERDKNKCFDAFLKSASPNGLLAATVMLEKLEGENHVSWAQKHIEPRVQCTFYY